MANFESVKAVIEKVDDTLYATARVVACAAVFGMIALTFIDVAGRQFFSAVPGASEIISTMLAISFFAGMSLVVHGNGHIVVGIAVGKYNSCLALIEKIFSTVVSFLSMGLITWMMYTKGVKLAAEGTLSKFLSFPMSYVAYAIALLALVATIINLLRLERIAKEDGVHSSRGEKS